MFDIKYYPTLEEAFDAVMKKDDDHILIRHSYPEGTKIHTHTHEVDEWVIASKGNYRLDSQGEEMEVSLDGKQVMVVHYPAGTDHGLISLSDDADYFVLRYPAEG